MKKFVALGLTALMMVSNVFASEISVKLNGNDVEFATQEPVIIEGRTLIPLRGVFEQLGYDISWDNDSKTATFVKGDTEVVVTVNKSEFSVNGESVSLDVPAQIVNGSMMLPLRAIGEATGLSVGWEDVSKTVTLDESIVINEETEQTTEEVEEASDTDFGVSAEKDLEQIQKGARGYVNYYTIFSLANGFDNLVSYNEYKIQGSKDFYFTKESIAEIYDYAVSASQCYLDAVDTLKTGNIDRSVVKAFKSKVVAEIDFYKLSKDITTTSKYEGLTDDELESKLATAMKIVEATDEKFANEMNNVVAILNEVATTEKYNVIDEAKLSAEDKEKRDTYYKAVGDIFNEGMKFFDSYVNATNQAKQYERFSTEMKEKISALDAPEFCILDREIFFECCNTLYKVGDTLVRGAFRDSGRNAAYLEFEALMYSFDLNIDDILGDYYDMKFIKEDSEDGAEISEDFESKII